MKVAEKTALELRYWNRMAEEVPGNAEFYRRTARAIEIERDTGEGVCVCHHASQCPEDEIQ